MRTYVFELYYGNIFLGSYVSQAETIDRAMNALSEKNSDIVWHNITVNQVLRSDETGKLEPMEV